MVIYTVRLSYYSKSLQKEGLDCNGFTFQDADGEARQARSPYGYLPCGGYYRSTDNQETVQVSMHD